MTDKHVYAVKVLSFAAHLEADEDKLRYMVQSMGDFRRFCEIIATEPDNTPEQNLRAVRAFIDSGICNDLLRMATLWMMTADLVSKHKAAFGAIVDRDDNTTEIDPNPSTNNEQINEALDTAFKDFLTKLHKSPASQN